MSSRPKLISLDAFSKTVEDVRIRTASGGIITLICVLIVLILINNEYKDYTLIIVRPELLVDRDINKKMDINLDVSFPNLPCDVMTLDLLDSTGDLNLDILRSGFQKFRIVNGKEILDDNTVLGNEMSLYDMAKGLPEGEQGECGSCYGSLPQDQNQFCCNDCETVKLAYAKKSWAFYDGENIDQCESSGYVARLRHRINNNEGCRVRGTTKINRVAGNLHFAPGASGNIKGNHYHDISLYYKYEDKFNFDHTIHHLSFGNTDEAQLLDVDATHPLDNFENKLDQKNHVFSYFLKVVATRFETLNKGSSETNQFSAIRHDRPLRGGKDEDHQHTLHARGGIPGVFIHFEISPLKIVNKEQYAKTWSGFVLGVISSIAGVLMVGTVVDRSVWAAEKAISNKKDL